MNNDEQKKQINYWIISAKRNWLTALDLFRTTHYDACLFFCHLTLEKVLKAFFVKKTKKSAPYVHNLEQLAQVAGLDLTDNQILSLRTITTFNIAGRYDEEKFAFYKKCTKDFTSRHLRMAKELYLWLRKEFLKN